MTKVYCEDCKYFEKGILFNWCNKICKGNWLSSEGEYQIIYPALWNQKNDCKYFEKKKEERNQDKVKRDADRLEI